MRWEVPADLYMTIMYPKKTRSKQETFRLNAFLKNHMMRSRY